MSGKWISRFGWISLSCLAGCGESPRAGVDRTPVAAPPRVVAIAPATIPDVVPATKASARIVAESAVTRPDVTDSDPRDVVPYLASDELEGRGVGMEGLQKAGDFIAGEFEAAGLKRLPGMGDFFQRLDYTSSQPGKCALTLGKTTLAQGKDFLPVRFSADGAFASQVVFAGYGISDLKAGYDDYAGVDAKGKMALVMRQEPVNERGRSRLIKAGENPGWSEDATFVSKIKAAKEHGAMGLMIVNPPAEEADRLMPFSAVTPGQASGIAAMQITREAAERLLADSGAPGLKALRDGIDSTFQPHSMPLSTWVSGTMAIDRPVVHIRNVVACLPGAGPDADEVVVVGAHYDHLGRGGSGFQFGQAGSIYHGADDNASGTAALIELAARMGKAPPPPRTILFVAFTGEEEGLVGSDYFVNHPPVALEKIVAMLNLDMVGRMKDGVVYVGGQGTAKDFDSILKTAAAGSKLTLKSMGRGGMGPSDQMSFANKHVPVIFLFSGLHSDYHRPTDTAGKINYEGEQEIVDLAEGVIRGMLRMPKEPYETAADEDGFNPFGRPMDSTRPSHPAVLGVSPDMASADSRVGVIIGGTVPGGPAETAGLKGGDLIVAIEGNSVENLMDLTRVLAGFKPGDRVKVAALRGEKKLEIEVVLGERSR